MNKRKSSSAIPAERVFVARRRYCKSPTAHNYAAFERVRKAYESRYPNRRLRFFGQRVEVLLGRTA